MMEQIKYQSDPQNDTAESGHVFENDDRISCESQTIADVDWNVLRNSSTTTLAHDNLIIRMVAYQL